MTRKEKLDLIISKVPEDKKEAFVAELREGKTKEDRYKIAKKYNVVLTEEEIKSLRSDTSHEVADEDLDAAAGGCSSCGRPCMCGCHCYCH